MTTHWEESNVNISHAGMQELQQGETSEASKNILWDVNSDDYKKAKTASLVKPEAERKAFIKKYMEDLQVGDHSKQIEGAAQVFSLLGEGNPSNDRIQYEKIRELSLETMRKNATYQFCMLLAGFNNVKISKYWITPSESEMRSNKRVKTEHSGRRIYDVDTRAIVTKQPWRMNERVQIKLDDFGVPDENGKVYKGTFIKVFNGVDVIIDDKTTGDTDSKFHKWYVQTAWADGTIHLSPEIYAHLDEAYTMVIGKWLHLKDVGMNEFIEQMPVRTYFARLVSWNMRTSDCLSGKRFHLQSTYSRVNHEKAKVLAMFKHIHYKDGKLFVNKQDVEGRYIAGAQVYSEEQKYLDEKQLVLNRRDNIVQSVTNTQQYIDAAARLVKTYNRY